MQLWNTAKAARNMFVKLTIGIDFIFTGSFCSRRYLKCKKTDDLTVFFILLGSAHAKAVFDEIEPRLTNFFSDYKYSHRQEPVRFIPEVVVGMTKASPKII